MENVSLKEKGGNYNNAHCVVDLWNNKILIYWLTPIFAPCTFTFLDNETFLYIDYNKDGTVRKYTHGILSEDFFFDWIKKYSQREISLNELSEYGFN